MVKAWVSHLKPKEELLGLPKKIKFFTYIYIILSKFNACIKIKKIALTKVRIINFNQCESCSINGP
jgi:hypothetical protein